MSKNNPLPTQVTQFLGGHALMALATCDSQGFPSVSFIYYVCSQDYQSIYITMQDGSEKLQNMINEPKIALAVVEQSTLTTVQMKGTAKIVTNDNKRLAIIDMYAEVANTQNEASFPPVIKLKGESLVVVEIALDWYKYSEFMSNPPVFLESKL